jgi:hypothetical protein
MDMTKDKIEVGSKWVAKIDRPQHAGILTGDVVTVSRVDATGIVYHKDEEDLPWYAETSLWHNHFEPYVEEPLLNLGYFDYPDFLGAIGNIVDKLSAVSDGGPAEYYDFPEGALTLNDLIEHKDMDFHRGNIFKACWRYGTKKGVSKEYDARKVIYSGARLLMKLVGVAELRNTLIKMLDDPQFQDREHKLK